MTSSLLELLVAAKNLDELVNIQITRSFQIIIQIRLQNEYFSFFYEEKNVKKLILIFAIIVAIIATCCHPG